MKHYPRAFNRFFLFVLGLLLTAAGAGVILVSLWPPAANWWETNTAWALQKYSDLVNSSYVVGQDFSWITLAWVCLLILLSLAAIALIFSQGGGRLRTVIKQPSQRHRGLTSVREDLVEELCAAMVRENRWVAAVTVSGYRVKRKPGLLINLQCYKGAPVSEVKQFSDRMMAQLDTILGQELPVLVKLSSGWHSTFGAAERVR